jgi:predicted nucleic acid-binding protein
MDVVLDSNTIIADYALRSPRFAALWDYLRKSDSRLVLFKLVYDEVIEHYIRDFDDKVSKRWEKFQGLLIARHPRPDIQQQLKTLRARLKAPSEAVHVVFAADYANVSMDEVVTRGIKRLRPASSSGEELRDVVLWLAALDYARREKRPLAFVTNDSGFWQEAAEEPAEQIRSDINDVETVIRLYRTVESFLAENGLTKKPVEAHWANQIFSTANLADVLLRRVVGSELPSTSVTSSSVASVELESGALYDITADAQFAELSYRVKYDAELQLLPVQTPYSLTDFARLDLNPENLIINPIRFSPNPLAPGIAAPIPYASGLLPPYSMYPAPLWTAPPSEQLRQWLGQPVPMNQLLSEPVNAGYAIEVGAKFSVRLMNGKPTEVKLDSYKLLGIVSSKS